MTPARSWVVPAQPGRTHNNGIKLTSSADRALRAIDSKKFDMKRLLSRSAGLPSTPRAARPARATHDLRQVARAAPLLPWLCILSACSSRPTLPLQQPVGRTHAPVAALTTQTPGRAPPPDEPSRPPPPAAGSAHAPALLCICDLPDTRAQALFFSTDDFSLRARGTQILDDIIACMSQGWLGGRTLVISAYSDPRGSAEYNRELALQRAHAVQRYLLSRGVPAERLAIAAHGEAPRAGTGPESWMLDRRVEISLAPPADRTTPDHVGRPGPGGEGSRMLGGPTMMRQHAPEHGERAPGC